MFLKEEIKKDLYPNLYKLIQAAMVIPISTAGCERSFSAMRRIKTWLRSTMGDEKISQKFTKLELSLLTHFKGIDKHLDF